jgi:predicted nucleic acid-binding protein
MEKDEQAKNKNLTFLMSYVLDSFAILALFRNEKGADEVVAILNSAISDFVPVSITSYSAGEVYYITFGKDSPSQAQFAIDKLLALPVKIIEPDFTLTLKAAGIKAASKLSYADAHAVALALDVDATLVTGDKEFSNVKVKGFKMKLIG